MKRLITLLLAAGIMLGGVTMGTANAVELKAGGQWQFFWGWMDNTLEDPNGNDRFYARQRIRPESRFVADENLSATLQFEIGTGNWGAGAWGMGADATDAVKFRYGYVDWVVPGVDLKVRMGMQKMALPQYGVAALVFGGTNDTAGIALAYAPCDALDLNFFWARPTNTAEGQHDAVDVFALTGTWKGDGFKVSPFVMAASIGTLADLSGGNGGSNAPFLGYGLLSVGANYGFTMRSDSDVAWWLGIGGELTMFDPFRFGLDFAYGSVDMGENLGGDGFQYERKGWLVSALASYKLDMVTPGLAFWYGSGDDDNIYDGSERMPFIFQDVDNLSPYFFDSGFMNSNYAQTFAGTWGVQLRFDNLSFFEGLKHDLRAGYMKGTNDAGVVKKLRAAAPGYFDSLTKNFQGCDYLTDEDSAWFLNFDTTYQIYKNLTAELNLGYMKFSWDDAVWGSGKDDKMYVAGVTMTYKF